MLAIFLIITLAAIGVYLVTTSTAQNQAVVQDEQAARAYQAARTGLEVAAYQLLRPVTANCVPTQTLILTQGLAGFFAEVTCTSLAESEGGVTVNVYRVTSTGCNVNPCTPSPATPGAPTYVERQLVVTINRNS